ncbi:uncharacterized protein PS065_007690 [Dugong dugon]
MAILRLLSRARPVTDQQSLRTARSSPNPRAQVDSAGPRPALSAGPTPPRPPGRSPVPAARAGSGGEGSEEERLRGPGGGGAAAAAEIKKTLTNTRPGARATEGASPRAREPILLSAGASLPAAWWCRMLEFWSSRAIYYSPFTPTSSIVPGM